MAWFKLDDGFFHHPKVVQAGRDARDLWLAAGCYCAKELTDGVVPAACLPLLAAEAQVSGPGKLAARLVVAGLFEERDGGYAIHDYLAYNPSRATVLAERARVNEVRAAAGRLGGLRSGAVRRRQAAADARVEGKHAASKREANEEANQEAKPKQNGSPVPVPLPHGMPASMTSSDKTDMAGTTLSSARERAGPPDALSAEAEMERTCPFLAEALVNRLLGRRGERPDPALVMALVAALVAAFGYAGQTAAEERRLAQAARDLLAARDDAGRPAPVQPAEVAVLKAAWERDHDYAATPWTLVQRLGELRQLATGPPAPGGLRRRAGGRQTFRDKLDLLEETTAILEAHQARNGDGA
jgi:hypothetical protein